MGTRSGLRKQTPSGIVGLGPHCPASMRRSSLGWRQDRQLLASGDDGAVSFWTMAWGPPGKERRAGCTFQEAERVREISNYKESGVGWLLLSAIDGLEKTIKGCR